MIGKLALYYAFCLLITILLEETVAFFVFKIRMKSDLILVLLVNTLTNPLVVTLQLIANQYSPIPWIATLLALEIGACLTEGFIYKRGLYYNKINPYLISLILNCCSYFGGNLINSLLHLF